MTIHPLKLKELSDRYVVVVLDSDTPFFIRKDAPETAAVQQAVRGALDLMKNVTISVAVDDPHRIIAAHIDHPEERAAPRCPDRDELTSAFFSRQESIPSLPRDQVRWVSKIPGCASYRVSFVRAAAFSWIHPQHPRASAMLAVAWRRDSRGLQTRRPRFHSTPARRKNRLARCPLLAVRHPQRLQGAAGPHQDA
ncbi:MAG TPA: hypothetical protein PK493_07270, partial [Pseudomonadota bacterium]|nr:hypothetical protein [Pseudomonadota bacterium]